jgi:hypothetical protein
MPEFGGLKEGPAPEVGVDRGAGAAAFRAVGKGRWLTEVLSRVPSRRCTEEQGGWWRGSYTATGERGEGLWSAREQLTDGSERPESDDPPLGERSC